MSFFHRAKKPAPPAPVIRDPFAVIPAAPENLERKADSVGRLHLRLRVELKGFRRRVADWMGYDYSRKIELDEHGTLYFSLVDGRCRLGEIVDRMAAASARPRKEVEEAVILFTKKLMVMNMLYLKVPEAGSVKR